MNLYFILPQPIFGRMTWGRLLAAWPSSSWDVVHRQMCRCFPLENIGTIQKSLSRPQWQAVPAQTQPNRPRAYYSYHVSQMEWGSPAGMQCFPLSKHNTSQLNQKVLFWSHLSIKLYSNSFQACPHTLQQTIGGKQCYSWKAMPFSLHSDWRLDCRVIFVGGPVLGRVTISFHLLYTICLTVDCCSPNTSELVLQPFPAQWASTILFWGPLKCPLSVAL